MRLLSPRYWGVHLVALVLVGAAGWLGFWQFDAWQTRRAAEAVDLTRVPPVPLGEVMGPDDPFPGDRAGQPVEVAGTWLSDETFFVDSGDGMWVVTPLRVTGEDAALLVVRGRTDHPATAPAAPVGEAEIVGWLQPSDETTAPDPDPADDVLPALRVSDALQRLDEDLYGGYAVVAADEPGINQGTNTGTEGLAPARPEELPEASRFTALRNLLYGLEWWVFGAFAAFVWWRYLRDQPGEQPAEPTEDTAEPPAGEPHQDAVRSEP
jgi:surfeit locus 1 family protein